MCVPLVRERRKCGTMTTCYNPEAIGCSKDRGSECLYLIVYPKVRELDKQTLREDRNRSYNRPGTNNSAVKYPGRDASKSYQSFSCSFERFVQKFPWRSATSLGVREITSSVFLARRPHAGTDIPGTASFVDTTVHCICCVTL